MTTFKPIILMITSIFMLCEFGVTAIPSLDYFEKNTIFNSFHREGSINVTLEMNLTKLAEDKNTNTYQKVRMSYIDNNGKAIERKVKIKARGRYRRKICDVTPMMLKFSKKELVAEGSKAHNKLKLVTHCLEDNAEESEQNLLKEFLVYKMLNVLSEKSYKVQLVNITYIDKENDNQLERLGFIIESTAELGERLEGVSKLIYSINVNKLEPTQYQTVVMFQYMISNTDWEIHVCRNIKIFYPENTDKIILVPYDFDFSGLVNAPYAIVNPNFPISNLRERVFQGQFNNEEELNKTLDLFRDKKKEMIALCENFKALKKKNRRDVSNFVKSFYRSIEDDELVKSEFLENK